MKTIYYLFLIFTFSLFACGSIKEKSGKSPLTISPVHPELFVNQKTDPYTIRVKYTLNIPADFLSAKDRLVYVPRIIAPGHEYALKPLVVSGSKFRKKHRKLGENSLPSVNISEGRKFQWIERNMQIEIDEVVPFQLWMTQAKLLGTAIVETRHTVKTFTQTVANGIVYIPLGPGPVRVKYVEKEIPVSQEMIFYFRYPVNVSFLYPDLSDNLEQLNKLGDLLLQIKHSPSQTLDRIVITGMSSPDGSLAYNERLSMKRANNFLQYLENTSGPFNIRIEVRTEPQDWQGFLKLVEESDIPDKKAVLSILNSDRTAQQKNKALQQLPHYKYLFEHIYPQLQQTSCSVYYTTTMIKTIPVPE